LLTPRAERDRAALPPLAPTRSRILSWFARDSPSTAVDGRYDALRAFNAYSTSMLRRVRRRHLARGGPFKGALRSPTPVVLKVPPRLKRQAVLCFTAFTPGTENLGRFQAGNVRSEIGA